MAVGKNTRDHSESVQMTPTDYHNLLEDAQLEIRTADSQLAQIDQSQKAEEVAFKVVAVTHLSRAKQQIEAVMDKLNGR